MTKWRHRNIAFLRDDATACFVQTPEQRRRLVAAGVPFGKVVCDRASYRVPDDWAIRPSAEARPGTRFGFIGRVSPEKGLHVLAEAINTLGGTLPQDVELQIIGAWNDGDPYADAVIGQLAQAPGVAVKRAIAHTQLGQFLASLDTLLIPSVWLENHPTVLTYALALEIEVVCSAVPSLAHLAIETGVHFVPIGDVEAWASVLSESPRRAARGAWSAGMRRRCEILRFERMVDRVEQLLGAAH